MRNRREIPKNINRKLSQLAYVINVYESRLAQIYFDKENLAHFYDEQFQKLAYHHYNEMGVYKHQIAIQYDEIFERIDRLYSIKNNHMVKDLHDKIYGVSAELNPDNVFQKYEEETEMLIQEMQKLRNEIVSSSLDQSATLSDLESKIKEDIANHKEKYAKLEEAEDKELEEKEKILEKECAEKIINLNAENEKLWEEEISKSLVIEREVNDNHNIFLLQSKRKVEEAMKEINKAKIEVQSLISKSKENNSKNNSYVTCIAKQIRASIDKFNLYVDQIHNEINAFQEDQSFFIEELESKLREEINKNSEDISKQQREFNSKLSFFMSELLEKHQFNDDIEKCNDLMINELIRNQSKEILQQKSEIDLKERLKEKEQNIFIKKIKEIADVMIDEENYFDYLIFENDIEFAAMKKLYEIEENGFQAFLLNENIQIINDLLKLEELLFDSELSLEYFIREIEKNVVKGRTIHAGSFNAFREKATMQNESIFNENQNKIYKRNQIKIQNQNNMGLNNELKKRKLKNRPIINDRENSIVVERIDDTFSCKQNTLPLKIEDSSKVNNESSFGYFSLNANNNTLFEINENQKLKFINNETQPIVVKEPKGINQQNNFRRKILSEKKYADVTNREEERDDSLSFMEMKLNDSKNEICQPVVTKKFPRSPRKVVIKSSKIMPREELFEDALRKAVAQRIAYRGEKQMGLQKSSQRENVKTCNSNYQSSTFCCSVESQANAIQPPNIQTHPLIGHTVLVQNNHRKTEKSIEKIQSNSERKTHYFSNQKLIHTLDGPGTIAQKLIRYASVAAPMRAPAVLPKCQPKNDTRIMATLVTLQEERGVGNGNVILAHERNYQGIRKNNSPKE